VALVDADIAAEKPAAAAAATDEQYGNLPSGLNIGETPPTTTTTDTTIPLQSSESSVTSDYGTIPRELSQLAASSSDVSESTQPTAAQLDAGYGRVPDELREAASSKESAYGVVPKELDTSGAALPASIAVDVGALPGGGGAFAAAIAATSATTASAPAAAATATVESTKPESTVETAKTETQAPQKASGYGNIPDEVSTAVATVATPRNIFDELDALAELDAPDQTSVVVVVVVVWLLLCSNVLLIVVVSLAYSDPLDMLASMQLDVEPAKPPVPPAPEPSVIIGQRARRPFGKESSSSSLGTLPFLSLFDCRLTFLLLWFRNVADIDAAPLPGLAPTAEELAAANNDAASRSSSRDQASAEPLP
jgi:hypothetical protein